MHAQKLIWTLVIFLACESHAQSSFSEFYLKFPLKELPIDSIQYQAFSDTIAVASFNDYVWKLQEKDSAGKTVKPKVYKNGKLFDLRNFGLVDNSALKYELVDGSKGLFYVKLYPIARIVLHPNYISIIIKTFNTELCYYDLYNFTKDGKMLSAVPLFKYAHDKLLIDSIDYTYLRSSIAKDGSITWFENYKGLKTARVYKLKEDGYFEITKEVKTGEFEY
jgi:hypothetical protein